MKKLHAAYHNDIEFQRNVFATLDEQVGLIAPVGPRVDCDRDERLNYTIVRTLTDFQFTSIFEYYKHEMLEVHEVLFRDGVDDSTRLAMTNAMKAHSVFLHNVMIRYV